MKNLIVERELCTLLDIGEEAVVASFCVNATESRLYAITTNGIVVCAGIGENPTVLWRYFLSDEFLVQDDDVRCVQKTHAGSTWLANFSHILEMDALCIATRGGVIALLHVDSDEVEAQCLEQVGSIDGGLVALEWSPDGELLAALSATGNLLVMNQAWELLYEGPALGTAVAAESSHSVWPQLYRDGHIAWRGDGKFFAVICRDPSAATACKGPVESDASPLPPYRVRIWDRNTLELHASGEAADGLLPLAAWQPNGRHLYIAAAPMAGPAPDLKAAANARPSILLYERNGLRHGELCLSSPAPVYSLAWSCDSELLAVVTSPYSPADDVTSGSESQDWIVQLWHRSNWHWYLKHERRYPHGVGPAAGLAPHLHWDEQYGSLLHILTPGGMYEQVGMVWDTCVSEQGTAIVIDGNSLLLTPLRHGVIPPPMCAARVALPEAAVDVCVSLLPAPATVTDPRGPAVASGTQKDEDEVIAALTSRGRLVIARSIEEDLWEETLEDQEALASEITAHSSAFAQDRVLLPAVPELAVPIAGGRRARAVCWLYGSSSLLVLASPYPEAGLEDEKGDALVQVDVEWTSCGPADPTNPRISPDVRLTEGPPLYTGERVLRMAPHGAGGVAVQLAGGTVARFCHGAQALVPCGPKAALPSPCSVVRSIPALVKLVGQQEEAAPLIGLSRLGMLCWGSSVIAPGDVTSVAVRTRGPGGPVLLYTTRKNLLYTVLITQLPSYTHRELTADPRALRSYKREGDVQAAMHAAMRPDIATAAARDVAVRAVEAGAVLVGCPVGASGPYDRLAEVPVVLQMPRGNLEGVAPRALVLAALVGALRRRDFREAWRLASLQRVDLNLLVDYGWPSFMTHAAEFVAAVPRPSDLCDLLFALRSGSVLVEGGAFAGALAWLGERDTRGGEEAASQQRRQQTSGPGSTGASGDKVAAVCRAVREAVLALPDTHKYLEVVVTSYARSDPPQLEDAMHCIREAKERELSQTAHEVETASVGPNSTSQAASATHSSPADKALKHLLLYVDADEMYNTALGMYDMPLAYMVVVNAQKDPGEYLAELQRFASLSPPPLQRHAVDMSLRRYASALSNLVQAGPQYFNQALQLARERGLLRQLLQLYDEDSERRPAVLEAYGEHLEAAKRYDDAAVSYLAAGQLEKALRAYRAAGRWRMVFVVAGQLEYDEAAVQSLAAEVVEELAAGGQAAEAAAVLLNYLGDVDNAVRTYTQAREWREAIRVAHANCRSDLVETVVAPAAAEGATSLLTEARESGERIRKYGQRLADVRARRLALAAAVSAADEDGAAHGVQDDLQSDVVSLVSGLSVYTDATAVGNGAAVSAASSSRAPSTVGGRKAHRQGKKLQKAGARIRQGSPLEEASLVAHVHGLAPRPSVLEEAGQLAELLVLLRHQADARTLQIAVSTWQEAYQEFREQIRAHPIPLDGPGHVHAEIERLLQHAPDTSAVAWKWDVLRSFSHFTVT